MYDFSVFPNVLPLWMMLLVSLGFFVFALPRGSSNGLRVGFYGRYSALNQRDASIGDQKRNALRWLKAEKFASYKLYEFADRGISGEDPGRKEFNRLIEMVERRELDVVIVDEFSRMTRGLDFAPLLAKMESRRCRFIGVLDGIDSNVLGYEMNALMRGVMNHIMNRMNGLRSRRGIEGRVLDGNGSYGGQCYGYSSRFCDPEAAANYTGTGPKPTRYNVIDEEQRPIVLEIFARYGEKGDSAGEIAENLNSRGVPLGNRSARRGKDCVGQVQWHTGLIYDMLNQRKYIGDWSWGLTYTVKDENGKPVVLDADAEDITPSHRPDLAIVPMELWDKVQARLKSNREKYGIRTGPRENSYRHDHPRNPVSRLLHCGDCGHPLHHASSASGVYYRCPVAHSRSVRADGRKCGNRGFVNFAKATASLTDYLGADFKVCQEWLGAVYDELVGEYRRRQAAAPGELERLQDRLRVVTGKIARLADMVEDGEISDASLLRERLGQRVEEKYVLESEIRRLEAGRERLNSLPDMAWVQQKLKDLPGIFKSEPRRAVELFRVFFGRVRAHTLLAPGKKRGPTELRFNPNRQGLVSWAMAVVDDSGDGNMAGAGDLPEVRLYLGGNDKVDLRMPEILELRAQGKSFKAIATELGLSKRQVHSAYTQRQQALAAAGTDAPISTHPGGVDNNDMVVPDPIQPEPGDNGSVS